MLLYVLNNADTILVRRIAWVNDVLIHMLRSVNVVHDIEVSRLHTWFDMVHMDARNRTIVCNAGISETSKSLSTITEMKRSAPKCKLEKLLKRSILFSSSSSLIGRWFEELEIMWLGLGNDSNLHMRHVTGCLVSG